LKESIKHLDYWIGILELFISGALFGYIQRGEMSLNALWFTIPICLLGFYLTVIKQYKPKDKSDDEVKRGE
jgi:hypothetical protein